MTLTTKDFKSLKTFFLTKDEFENFQMDLDQKLTTYRSDIMDKLDSILKEILASREEETILAHKVSKYSDRIEDIENRLGFASN